MLALPFTLATYRVKSRREGEFIDRWRDRQLCDELSPDDYEVVMHVRVRPGGDV